MDLGVDYLSHVIKTAKSIPANRAEGHMSSLQTKHITCIDKHDNNVIYIIYKYCICIIQVITRDARRPSPLCVKET